MGSAENEDNLLSWYTGQSIQLFMQIHSSPVAARGAFVTCMSGKEMRIWMISEVI